MSISPAAGNVTVLFIVGNVTVSIANTVGVSIADVNVTVSIVDANVGVSIMDANVGVSIMDANMGVSIMH